jgi:hypothetical protein
VLTRLTHNEYFEADRFKRLLARYRWLQPAVLLPAFFVLVAFRDLSSHSPEDLGIDARIYYRAALAFAHGISPWESFVTNTRGNDLHFAALPPTVLVFQPFTLLPEKPVVWLWILLSCLAAFSIIRSLRLPAWWLAFPPMAQGIFSANPQIVLLALLLSGSASLAAIAPMLKIYAIAPLVGERRVAALALTAVFLLASLVVAPGLWSDYIAHGGSISERVLREARGGYSALGHSAALTIAAIVGLGLLAIVDLRAAGWLAGPALVPASQLHLSTMAMPVMARPGSLFLTVLLALPVRGLPSAAVAIYGAWRSYEFLRRKLGRGARVPLAQPSDSGSH